MQAEAGTGAALYELPGVKGLGPCFTRGLGAWHGAKVVVGATDLLVEKAVGIPWVGVLGVAVFGAIKGIGASISQIPREFKKPSEQRQLEAAARKLQSEIGDVRSSISATRLGDFLFLLLLALIVVIVTWCVS